MKEGREEGREGGVALKERKKKKKQVSGAGWKVGRVNSLSFCFCFVYVTI